MNDLVVIARNAPEMAVAQQGLVGWAREKMKEAAEDRREIETNLELAKKNGWRTTGLQRAVRLARKQHEFYHKIAAALGLGYVIVPNFPIDVFAIRTTKKEPKGSTVGYGPEILEQASEGPPVGEGTYVSVDPTMSHAPVKVTCSDGSEMSRTKSWAEEFQKVMFPMVAVKPQIIEDTAAAMRHAIFDEIGIAPEGRQKDPMIIGRVFYRNGAAWNRREVSFLISWWLTNRDLELRRLV